MMIILCIVSYFLYAANKQYEFMPNLTPMGLFRRLPYYYLGYVMGQQRTFRSVRIWRDGMLCLACLILSLLFFEWHLNEQQILLHAALFYPVNIGLLFAVLCFCKLLDACRLVFITNLSIGTLVIIGLHIILIGIVNYAVDHFIGIRDGLGYYWYEALPITAIIIALLYPIILWGKNQAPVLIGKNKNFVHGTDSKK